MIPTAAPPGAVAKKLLAVARRFARPVLRWAGRNSEPSPFGVNSLAALNERLSGWGLQPLSKDPHLASRDTAAAARYVLALLADSPRLWRRFPAALSEGADGRFARWIYRGLTSDGAANVRSVFAENPGLSVKRIYELRCDLRDAFVLGLTPHQRTEYLTWLLTYGRDDFRVTPEQALWYAAELSDDPSRGLVATYRSQPKWQRAVPHGLTRFGWADLKSWIAAEYGIDADWLRRASLPQQFGPWDELQFLLRARPELAATFPADCQNVPDWVRENRLPGIDRNWFDRLGCEIREKLPAHPGVNVIGLFRYTSGLQQAVKSCVESLSRNNVRTALRDYPVLFLREPRNRAAFDALEQFGVTIINTGLDTPVSETYRLSGLHPRAGVYRIGLWWWEMEQLPAEWLGRGDEVDEIWAPTRFIADAMRAAFRKPVFPMLPGMELSPFDPLPRSAFGLRDDRFVFSFVFDMNSRIQRKNPVGLIHAFRKAFRRDEPVDLVIKVSPPESYYKEQWSELRTEVDAAGVTLIDRVLTRPELLAFLNASDCYASLHRSEGFGLTCAEAMLLGKPVVATGYSGNLDFMTPANSYLVDYDRVTLEQDIDPYPRGAAWAEPRLDHAAELLRRVYDRRDEAAEKGRQAMKDVRETLSLTASGRRMADRLDTLKQVGR